MPTEPTFAPILVDAEQAARLFSVCARQFHNLRKLPGFPAPIVLGQRSTRWLRADLEAYVAAMPRTQPAEPAQLTAARAAKAAGLQPAPAPFSGITA